MKHLLYLHIVIAMHTVSHMSAMVNLKIQKENRLLHLCKHGKTVTDFQEIQKIIEAGISPNCIQKLKNKRRPLYYLAGNHCSPPSLISWLVKKGAWVDAQSSSEETPFDIAILASNFNNARVLLREGACIDGKKTFIEGKNKFYVTPLYTAMYMPNRDDAVSFLLHHGVHPYHEKYREWVLKPLKSIIKDVEFLKIAWQKECRFLCALTYIILKKSLMVEIIHHISEFITGSKLPNLMNPTMLYFLNKISERSE